MTDAIERITFKPSVLVGASIKRAGGVSYERQNGDKVEDGDSQTFDWHTTRHIESVSKLKAADAVASECRRMLRTVCVPTAFGMIAAKDREPELDQIIVQIRAKIAEKNPSLAPCQLAASFLRGEISNSDREAVEALTKEIGGFLATLTAAVETCDVKKIRTTLAQMKGVDTLMPDTQSQTLQAAVSAARKAANLIVRQVEKKGETIEQVKQQLDLSAIDVARAMFVEVDDVAAPDVAAAGVLGIERVIEEAPEPEPASA